MSRQRLSSVPNFELVYKVTELASRLVGPHSTLSLGRAVEGACERLKIVLDDEGFALVVVALGFRRERQRAVLDALELGTRKAEPKCQST